MPLDPEDRAWLEGKFSEVHERMDTAFSGPEGEPHKGIWVRLDRAERILAVVTWAVALAVGGIITAVAKAFSGGASPPGGHP